MKLILVKGSIEYKNQITDMLREWTDYNNNNEANHSPWAIFKNDYSDFEFYLSNLDNTKPHEGYVPSSTFFCLDVDRNIMVGAVNIRHYLNEKLLREGGHIGDGVRPSERKKGVATKMIALALEECRKLNIDRVLMCCDKENIGSAKSIKNNGGVLENEITIDSETVQRYWIDLTRITNNSI